MKKLLKMSQITKVLHAFGQISCDLGVTSTIQGCKIIKHGHGLKKKGKSSISVKYFWSYGQKTKKIWKCRGLWSEFYFINEKQPYLLRTITYDLTKGSSGIPRAWTRRLWCQISWNFFDHYQISDAGWAVFHFGGAMSRNTKMAITQADEHRGFK